LKDLKRPKNGENPTEKLENPANLKRKQKSRFKFKKLQPKGTKIRRGIQWSWTLKNIEVEKISKIKN
jgi:hypothetical protein